MKEAFKILLTTLLFALFVLSVSGCEGTESNSPSPDPEEGTDPDGDSGNDITLGQIDITNAQNLFISKASSTKSDGSATLFKITDEGSVEEVCCYDVDNNQVTYAESPTYVQNIDENFVVVIFGYDLLNPKTAYLVRKTDGAVFDLGEALPVGGTNNFKNSKIIQSDGQGNLYFIYSIPDASSGYYLRKIDIEDPDNITSQRVNPDTDNISSFTVASDGTVLYAGTLVSDMQSSANRIIKTNGGVYDISYTYFSFWTGLDGSLYMLSDNNNYTIEKCTIDENYNVGLSDYGSSLEVVINGTNYYPPSLSYNSYLLQTADRCAIYEVDSPQLIFEVDNSSQTPQGIDISGAAISSVTSVSFSENYYYIAGSMSNSGNIAKIDPASGSATQLLSSGMYSVYRFSVSSSDQVMFNALRYSDGAKVIGSVDASGSAPYTVSILDESRDLEMSVLERLE